MTKVRSKSVRTLVSKNGIRWVVGRKADSKLVQAVVKIRKD